MKSIGKFTSKFRCKTYNKAFSKCLLLFIFTIICNTFLCIFVVAACGRGKKFWSSCKMIFFQLRTQSGDRPSFAIEFSGKITQSYFLSTNCMSFGSDLKLNVKQFFLIQAGARAGSAKSDHGAWDLGLSPLLSARHQWRLACASCRQGRRGRSTLWAGAWSALWDLAHCLCQVLSWTYSLEDLSGMVISKT